MVKAVITGDIVHSTKLMPEQRQSLLTNIKHALKDWDHDFGMKSEIFRGDSFQCLLDPADALRVALIIKTHIRSLNPSELYDLHKRKNPEDDAFSRGQKSSVFYTNFIIDARIAIGIGETETVRRNLASSHGEAFIISGHLLDDIKNTKQAFAIGSADLFNDEWETESVLLDAILAKTTALQCHVINLKLLRYTEIQIAEILRIAQSAVNQRSAAGNWNAIEWMIHRFEKIYNHA